LKNLKKKKEKKENLFNKFDQYDFSNNQDYLYYSNKRNNYKQRTDIKTIFSKLKVDAQPFFPKSSSPDKKNKLSDIDLSKVKDFYPKNYKVVSKDSKEATTTTTTINDEINK